MRRLGWLFALALIAGAPTLAHAQQHGPWDNWGWGWAHHGPENGPWNNWGWGWEREHHGPGNGPWNNWGWGFDNRYRDHDRRDWDRDHYDRR
jgi:hypothetical protein